jgi:hypothetical protein
MTEITLTLTPPPGDDAGEVQTRIIEDVPLRIARKITEDFLRFGNKPDASRYRLYHIGTEKECLLPMDFGEVVEIVVPLN